jgi:hypothetical protein
MDFFSKGSLELFSATPEGVRFLGRKALFAPRGEPAFAITRGVVLTSDGSILNHEDFAFAGSITNNAGESMLAPGGSAVTLHPGERASFVQRERTYFADLETRRELGSVDIRLGQDYAIDTVAVGDQLIFLTGGGSIYFVRSEHLGAALLERPLIAPALRNGELVLEFTSRNGVSYRLQASSSLGGGWRSLGEAKRGTGGPLEFASGVPNSSQQFYQIVVE